MEKKQKHNLKACNPCSLRCSISLGYRETKTNLSHLKPESCPAIRWSLTSSWTNHVVRDSRRQNCSSTRPLLPHCVLGKSLMLKNILTSKVLNTQSQGFCFVLHFAFLSKMTIVPEASINLPRFMKLLCPSLLTQVWTLSHPSPSHRL